MPNYRSEALTERVEGFRLMEQAVMVCSRPLSFPEIHVPYRPILAKFRLGFWQIVCPGPREAQGRSEIRGVEE